MEGGAAEGWPAMSPACEDRFLLLERHICLPFDVVVVKIVLFITKFKEKKSQSACVDCGKQQLLLVTSEKSEHGDTSERVNRRGVTLSPPRSGSSVPVVGPAIRGSPGGSTSTSMIQLSSLLSARLLLLVIFCFESPSLVCFKKKY